MFLFFQYGKTSQEYGFLSAITHISWHHIVCHLIEVQDHGVGVGDATRHEIAQASAGDIAHGVGTCTLTGNQGPEIVIGGQIDGHELKGDGVSVIKYLVPVVFFVLDSRFLH